MATVAASLIITLVVWEMGLVCKINTQLWTCSVCRLLIKQVGFSAVFSLDRPRVRLSGNGDMC